MRHSDELPDVIDHESDPLFSRMGKKKQNESCRGSWEMGILQFINFEFCGQAMDARACGRGGVGNFEF